MPESSERHCCSITLIVIGDDLEPDKVTSALGWSPNQSWRRGEHKRFTRRDGTAHTFDSVHEWGGWKLFSSDEECELSLDKQFDAWMARLQSKGQEFRSLNDLGWHIELNFLWPPANILISLLLR